LIGGGCSSSGPAGRPPWAGSAGPAHASDVMAGYTKGECAARVQARSSATVLLRDGALVPGGSDRPLPAVIVRSFKELSSNGVRHFPLRIGKQLPIVKGDAEETV